MSTYASFTTALVTLAPTLSSDVNFNAILPSVIDYAEGRIYRDLDLLSVRITDTSVTCTSGVRTINLSTAQGTMLVVEQVSVLTSAGAPSSVAQRNPTYNVSPDFLNSVYPSAASSNTGQPEFFARVNDTQIIFGPAPDQAYGTEVIATIRPNPLSSGNSSTWLTQNVPELFLAGAMVFYSGYQRDFGSQSDNPQQAQSWESQYGILLKTAMTDELRKKYQSQAWTPQIPNPVASPPRV